MKTIKLKFSILITLFSILLLSLTLHAQEKKDSFEKTFTISSAGEFTFSCYDTDLKVNTWSKDEVKLVGEIIIQGGNSEDQDKLIEIFKNPKVSQSSKVLKIETNMVKNTIIIGPISNITLVNGKKIKIDKYNATYILWVPESIAFNLISKYNQVDILGLKGNVNFDLYDADLTLVSFGEKGDFKMKYCKAEIGTGDNAGFDVYDSDIEIKDLKIAAVTSKYCEFSIENVNMLNATSYDDDYKIQNISFFSGEAKYSDFKIESNLEDAFFNAYDSDISAKNINRMKYSAKYSSVIAQNVDLLEIKDLYDSYIKLGIVGEFSCQVSKYDEFIFESITKSISMPDAYTSALIINSSSSDLMNFTGNFKYGSVKLPLNPNLEFSLKYETTYGNFSFPQNRVKVKNMYTVNGNKNYFEGQTSDFSTCTIEINAYSTDFKF